MDGAWGAWLGTFAQGRCPRRCRVRRGRARAHSEYRVTAGSRSSLPVEVATGEAPGLFMHIFAR